MRTKLTLLLFAVALISGCNTDEAGKNTQTGGQAEVYVHTVRAQSQSYRPKMELAGTIKPWREANLGAALPGRVEKTYYEAGTYVKKGSLLVRLSGEKLAQARAEFNGLQKDLDRLKRLQKEGSVTQQKLDHVQSKYDAAKARMEMMEKNTTIHAPFAGTITSYQVHEGENFMFAPKMKPGYSHTSGILSLMQLNRLKVEVELNEKDLHRVKVGEQANVVADAYPKDTLQGKLHWIAPTLSNNSRTAKAEIAIPNPERRYKPGMYATATLVLPETKGVFIPLNAIYRMPGTGEDFVFLLQDESTVKRQKIVRQENRGELVRIEGLKAGKQVVTHGKTKLSDGQAVQVKN